MKTYFDTTLTFKFNTKQTAEAKFNAIPKSKNYRSNCVDDTLEVKVDNSYLNFFFEIFKKCGFKSSIEITPDMLYCRIPNQKELKNPNWLEDQRKAMLKSVFPDYELQYNSRFVPVILSKSKRRMFCNESIIEFPDHATHISKNKEITIKLCNEAYYSSFKLFTQQTI